MLITRQVVDKLINIFINLSTTETVHKNTNTTNFMPLKMIPILGSIYTAQTRKRKLQYN